MTFLSIPLCSQAKLSSLWLISSFFAHATHYLSIAHPSPAAFLAHSGGALIAIIGAIAALITAFAAIINAIRKPRDKK
jgi:hypothetical protein